MTVIPHDLDAETAMLGAMMLGRVPVEVGVARLVPEDFYNPVHALVFACIVDLYKGGTLADPVTVAAEMEASGLAAPDVGWRKLVHRIQAQTPSSLNAAAYADVIIERADRRRLLTMTGDVQAIASDPTRTIEDATDAARLGIEAVQRVGQSRTFPSFAEWRAGIDMTENWAMPGILERRDRMLLVAAEGFGKSHLLRQWALMAAAGVHWFTEQRVPPMQTLMIDVENSGRQIVRNTNAMYRMAEAAAPGFSADRFVIIPFATLDLTKRSDRLAVESYIAGHRPAILVIGPLYKILPPPGGKFSYEEQALQGISVIDDWRARYDIAVLIEHHAPKGSGGSRNLDPLGSSAWLRWPEFVLKLEPDDDPRIAKIGHARGQRERRAWPEKLERGKVGEWQWRTPFEERRAMEPF